jgi:uncharacterized protein (TIGR02246 family)
MTSDEQAIRELHASWIEAVNAGDLAPLLDRLADDAVLMGPGQAPYGQDGFIAAFSGAHRDLLLHCRSEQLEVVVAGDMAYTVSRDALSFTPRAGGETTRLAGHRLTIYRRRADGLWRLARDAHTLTPVTG